MVFMAINAVLAEGISALVTRPFYLIPRMAWLLAVGDSVARLRMRLGSYPVPA